MHTLQYIRHIHTCCSEAFSSATLTFGQQRVPPAVHLTLRAQYAPPVRYLTLTPHRAPPVTHSQQSTAQKCYRYRGISHPWK